MGDDIFKVQLLDDLEKAGSLAFDIMTTLEDTEVELPVRAASVHNTANELESYIDSVEARVKMLLALPYGG